MKLARSPIRAGSIASMRSRTRRATTGDAPPVPTATTTSPRSTMAGKMKVECERSSITFTGRPTDLRPYRHRNADIASTRTQNRNHLAEIGQQRIASGKLNSRRVGWRQAAKIMIAVGRVPAHVRTGGCQQAQLRPHQLAGPNHQHGASLQIEKHRQKSHALLSTPTYWG